MKIIFGIFRIIISLMLWPILTLGIVAKLLVFAFKIGYEQEAARILEVLYGPEK